MQKPTKKISNINKFAPISPVCSIKRVFCYTTSYL